MYTRSSYLQASQNRVSHTGGRRLEQPAAGHIETSDGLCNVRRFQSVLPILIIGVCVFV